MMAMIPKWRVTVTSDPDVTIALAISDQFLSNVLRKLADLEWPVQPTRITITRDKHDPVVVVDTNTVP